MVRVSRNLTRKSMALLTSMLLVLFWVPGLIAATPAGAATNTTVPGSPYNGSNGTIDSDSSIHSTTDPAGSSDTTSFTGGKEDDQCPGVSSQGLSSPKDDLVKAYFGSANGTTAGTATDVFLYLAWIRSTTNGTTTIDFELNQSTGAMAQCNGVNPQRTKGDLLFSYDFSNGGGNVDINYYIWDTSLNQGAGGWKAKGDITGLVDVNNKPIVEAATDNTGIQGEMAVNLTLLPGVFTANTCKDFGSAWAKTRSSTSFGSEIKDYITPQPTIISNCAPMSIFKQDSAGNPLAGAVFDISGTTPAVPAGQTPCTTRADGYCYVVIPGSSPTAYAKPLLFPGTYTVFEHTAPTGYLLDTTRSRSVTLPQTTNPATHAGEAVFTDNLGSITFHKVNDVTGLPLGGATFHITPNPLPGGSGTFLSVTDNGTGDAAAAAGTITVNGAQVGTYTISESAPPTGFVIDSTTRTAVVGDPQLDSTATANPEVTTAFRDPTVPSITAVKSSSPASGTVAAPTAVSPGQTISYTIAVTNSGSTQATGVVVTDAIPTGTTYVAASADNGGTLSSGSLSWTINVPGASTVNLHFQVTVDAADVNGTLIDNTAVFSNVNTPSCVAVGATTCSTNTTHHEVEFPVIGAVKSSNPTSGTVASPAPVTPGQTITYTIAVTNTGLEDAAAVAVTDAIPAGTTYVAGSADHGGTLSNGTLSWTLAVAHGATVNLQFQVTVDAGDVNGTLIDNTATVNGTSTNTTHHEVEFPVIGAVKSSTPTSGTVANPAPVTPGQTITYTIAVTNTGLQDAAAVTVTDAIPTGTTYVAGSADHGGTLGDGTLSWTLAVAHGATVNLQFQVTVNAGDVNGTLIDNTAHFSNIHTPNCVAVDASTCSTNTTHHEVKFPVIGAVKSSDPASGTVANPTPVAKGQTITYTIAVSNTGLAAAHAVPVTDAIPAGTTYVASSADHGGTFSNGTVSWAVDVAAQSSVSLHFQVTVNAGDINGTLIDNTATVDGTPTNTTHHVVEFSVIGAVKSSDPASGTVANPAPVTPGQTITYTIAVSNTGLQDAPAVAVTDAIPTGTTYVAGSADHGGTLSNGTLSWTVAVPHQSSVSLHFQVTVNAGDTNGTLIDNTATVDGTPTNTTHHEVKFPVVGAVKSSDPASGTVANPTPVTPGQTITYTIAVSNTGLAAANAVPVTDVIPAGTSYVAGSADNGGTFGNGTVSWTVNVAAQSSVSLHFQVTVNAGDANGTLIDNTATVNGTPTNTTHHEVKFPIVGAVKSSDPASGSVANPTPVTPGQTITYTIAVSNTGLAAANAVPVSDAIPAGTTYVGGSADNGGTFSNGTVSWTVNVAAQSTVNLHFQVTVDGSDGNGTLIDNTATVNGTPTDTTHHEVEFPVIGALKSSDPASGSVANPTPVTPGQTITYTIAVSNTGLQDATGVAVSDAIPAGTSYVAGSADHGGVLSIGSLSWSIDVAHQSTVNVTFQVTVDGSDGNGTLIDNTATVKGTPTDTTHHEVEFPVLTLAKSSNPASGSIVQRGDRIDYTVTLTNTGLDSVQKTITDTLPDHVTLVDGSATPAFTTINGSVVTWLVNVPANGNVTLTYSVTVDKDAPEGATLTNVALVDGQCVGNEDASACTTDHHVPTGALTLAKHVDKATASYGDTLTYTFVAGTTGALDQTNVVVHDVLPKGTAYVANSAKCSDAGPCTASFSGNTVTWQLGDMAAGATRHLVFKVTIVTPSFDPQVGLTPETIVNSGTIASTETPTTPSNQVVTKVVAVLGVKIVRPPKLPFTGLPAQTMLFAGLTMLGAGIFLTSVRRRREQ